jgi:hypothetical protein
MTPREEDLLVSPPGGHGDHQTTQGMDYEYKTGLIPGEL